MNMDLEELRAEYAALTQRIDAIKQIVVDILPTSGGINGGRVLMIRTQLEEEEAAAVVDAAARAAAAAARRLRSVSSASARAVIARDVSATAVPSRDATAVPSRDAHVVASRVAKSRQINIRDLENLRTRDGSILFNKEGNINIAALYTLLKHDEITAEMFNVTKQDTFNAITDASNQNAHKILSAIYTNFPHLKTLSASGAASVAAAVEAHVEHTSKLDEAVSNIGGGGRYHDFNILLKKRYVKQQQADKLFAHWITAQNPIPSRIDIQNFKDTDTNYQKEINEIELIKKELKEFMSNRSSNDDVKIDITADMITEAVRSINTYKKYTIPEGFPNSGKLVITLRDLRKYILKNINNDTVFLTLMTTDHGLNLNTVLPEYNPVVVEEQLQSKLVNGILVLTDENKQDYEMPNFAGDPQNRKKFSKLYDKDTCFGFGPLKRNPQCTALLLDCINGDTTRCRELLAIEDFEHMIEADMAKTNVFMIAKLLDNIGYPRVENGIKFDPDMNNWYSKIQAYFSLDDTDTHKKTLNDIKQNNNLKLALEHMVRKYNKYAKLINTNNLKITSLPAVYGKGGDASSALLAYDGYNTTGGSVTVLDGKHRNINAIYEMAKELKDKYDLTKEYTKLFTNLHTNIKNKNVVINDSTVIEFRNTLEEFKTTELKLNKLLVLFTNFAFLLNKDEQDNTESNQILLTLINKENMEKYITARNKIMTSLDKRRNKMTMMVGPYGPQIFSQY